MAKRKAFGVIVNPSSAGGQSLHTWRSLNLDVPYHISANEKDFREAVLRFAKKFDTIGVCGGDSSLTIAAEELLEKKFRGELVFIPAGSVNDIVLDIREQGASKPIYLAQVTTGTESKTFIGQANWGLGVVVNRWVGGTLRMFPFLRPLQNFIGTLCIIFAHLLRREIVHAVITKGKEQGFGSYSIVLVSQIRHWAGGLRFCPEASYLGANFEIVLVRRCNLVRLIRIILASKTGGHLRFPEVESVKAKEIRLEFDRPLLAQVDGDLTRQRAREFSMTKRKSAFKLTAV